VTIQPPTSIALPAGPSGLADIFRYCPRCGGERPRLDNNRSLRCDGCGFLFFFNSAAAAAAFIFHRDQLLLCVRGREPAKGMLDLPGGFVEFDEAVEECLRREIREELNLEVADFRYFASASNDYRYAGVPYKTTDLFFMCEAADLTGIRPGDDVADYVLAAPGAVDLSALAFASSRAAFGLLLERLTRDRERP
jgi:ADP-ribose pyrophosphatase YjhB (NUDIX family)